MEREITYKLNAADLQKVLRDELQELSKASVLGRYQDRLVGVDTVAEIHNIHRDTVIKYAAAGLLPHQRTGKLYKFSLAAILEIDFHELKRRA